METLKEYCTRLSDQMVNEIFERKIQHPNTHNYLKASLDVTVPYLDKLRSYIISHPFKWRSEEIYFFKQVKPAIMGTMIFLSEALNMEVERPINDPTKEIIYMEIEILKIDKFLTEQDLFYEYYQEGFTHMDHKLFVRKVEDRFSFRDLPLRILPVFYYGDPTFSTGYDYLFAQFFGMEQLKQHLQSEIEILNTMGSDIPKEEMKFTGSPDDFVELVRMIDEAGKPVDPKTGERLSREELGLFLQNVFKPEFGPIDDYKTLELTSNGSDLPERMQESMEKLYARWEKEEEDVEYGKDESGDDPKDNS